MSYENTKILIALATMGMCDVVIFIMLFKKWQEFRQYDTPTDYTRTTKLILAVAQSGHFSMTFLLLTGIFEIMDDMPTTAAFLGIFWFMVTFIVMFSSLLVLVRIKQSQTKLLELG